MVYAWFCALIASLGAFLFGYQTGIISGAVLFIAEDLRLTTFEQEMIVSFILIGCAVGALCGGFLNDFLGRKKTLLTTILIFLLGTFCLSWADHFELLLVGRLIVGLGVGIASLTVPLYLAEIAPTHQRGMFTALNQVMITVGILFAFWTAYAFSSDSDWRDMFRFAYIPTIIQMIGLFFMTETPAWLSKEGRNKEASHAAERLHGSHHHGHEEKQHDHPTVRRFHLFSASVRLPFLIGVGISAFQQFTGINTIVYYTPRIFQLAGYGSPQSAIFVSVWVAIVMCIATVGGLMLVDKVGRRKLLLIGFGGMCISLLVLSLSFLFAPDSVGLVAVISVLSYVVFFAAPGIIAWVLISEIYPLGIRGRAMGVATITNWVSNYIVSVSFLSLVKALSIGGTYLIYTLICALAFYFVFHFVPETKGKTFDEIQQFWKK